MVDNGFCNWANFDYAYKPSEQGDLEVSELLEELRGICPL
jgi:hypothetical protein